MAYFFCRKEPMDGVVVARELGDQMTFLVGFDVQDILIDIVLGRLALAGLLIFLPYPTITIPP